MTTLIQLDGDVEIKSANTAAISSEFERAGVDSWMSMREILNRASERNPRLKLDVGSGYDVVGRLERDGMVQMHWRERDRSTQRKGPRREQVYALTARGRRGLVAALTAYAQDVATARTVDLP